MLKVDLYVIQNKSFHWEATYIYVVQKQTYSERIKNKIPMNSPKSIQLQNFHIQKIKTRKNIHTTFIHCVGRTETEIQRDYKSGIKHLNTLGHLDQYMAQHGRIVKQSYCETV